MPGIISIVVDLEERDTKARQQIKDMINNIQVSIPGITMVSKQVYVMNLSSLTEGRWWSLDNYNIEVQKEYLINVLDKSESLASFLNKITKLCSTNTYKVYGKSMWHSTTVKKFHPLLIDKLRELL